MPSTFVTGYRYARMGYTTVIEPATPPLKTRHTHHELNDTPIVDKACFPLVGNNWFVMKYLSRGMFEECAAYLAWLLKATRGYALKVVNPGGVEAWGWGGNIDSIDDVVPNFGITPREIIRGLCRINLMLGLPHAVHLHATRIGTPGNFIVTLQSMDCVKDLAWGKPIVHITHCQFNAYGGEGWVTIASEADKIARYVNSHSHVSIDIGQVIFTDVTTMTADGPNQHRLHLLSGNKWASADVEAETAAGIVPFRFKRKSRAHGVQWAIGLELALLVNDPWRVYLTTDHPNGGPFTAYPRVISWLISREARERTLAKINNVAKRRINLPSIDREYDLSEVTVVTRAGTAKSLGLKSKGHLGVGADADISVYAFNPNEVDLSRDYKKVRKAFRRASYTVKAGCLVAKDGEILQQPVGRTYWVEADTPKDLTDTMLSNIREKFKEYYTLEFENYQVGEDELAVSAPVPATPRLG